MSGLFTRKKGCDQSTPCPRYVNLEAVDFAELAQSMRIYTMFGQMPKPLPHPDTPDNMDEIKGRVSDWADENGRMYTHKSTSNPSNTIHGVYLTLDATDAPDLDEVPPACNIFGAEVAEREWVSLEELR